MSDRSSLVREDRFPSGPLPVKADFAPDVAFEIISPGNTASEIQSKRQDYLESGVTQVWIDLVHRSIEVIYASGQSRFFGDDQVLLIEILPEFSLELKTLFVR